MPHFDGMRVWCFTCLHTSFLIFCRGWCWNAWFCNFEGLVAVVQKWLRSFQDALISDMNPACGGGMALPDQYMTRGMGLSSSHRPQERPNPQDIDLPGKAFFHFAICECFYFKVNDWPDPVFLPCTSAIRFKGQLVSALTVKVKSWCWMPAFCVS